MQLSDWITTVGSDWITVIGMVASVLGILEIGYLFGKRQESKRRRTAEDELVAQRISKVLGSVKITALRAEPREGAPGSQIAIRFTISSEATFPYEVWLGASLLDSEERDNFDVTQDKSIFLDPGTHTYVRVLTIPREIAAGQSRLIGSVNLGNRSNPDSSVRLARMDSHEAFTVIR